MTSFTYTNASLDFILIASIKELVSADSAMFEELLCASFVINNDNRPDWVMEQHIGQLSKYFWAPENEDTRYKIGVIVKCQIPYFCEI